jgi:ribosome-associated translation inhibitor RaiA
VTVSEQPHNVPIPDPTLLTTVQLNREIAALREVLETRLAGMDRATALIATELEKLTAEFRDRLDHQRADRDDQLAALREFLLGQMEVVRRVGEERFGAVAIRFEERDLRTQEAATQSRISLDAALAAAKEAVYEQNKANAAAIGKSEAATEKQINALVASIDAARDSLARQITDLKERLDRGEGKSQGGQAMWGLIAGGILLIVAVIGLYLNAKR